jgi:hypothetical protein
MTDLLARLYARCIEEGDCLIWQGSVTDSGMPRVNIDGKNGILVRRAVYAELHGSIPDGKVITPICGHKRCLAEHHLQAMTVAKSRSISARKGAYDNPARTIKRVLSLRARSHITEEVVDQVRQAETTKQAHLQTGVSLSYCHAIRSGDRRAELVTPFSGLMTRRTP